LLGNDWRFVIDFNLNDIDNSKYKLDEHNDIVLNHDKPDVEFNDDGSVHINTPGDYFFSNNDWEFVTIRCVQRRGGEQHYHRDNPDDRALD
jgi:hypothetical protein